MMIIIASKISAFFLRFFVFVFIFILAACASNPSSTGANLGEGCDLYKDGVCVQTSKVEELETTSDQTELQKKANIRLQLAVGYYQKGQFEIALNEVKQAITIHPGMADAYGVRALIYMEMGQLQLAEENFSRALKIAPNNPDILNNYGWFLCQHGREKKSIPFFESALKNYTYQSPSNASSNAGICSLKLNDFVTAERYLLSAIKLDINNVAAYINLAKLYYVQQQFLRAESYFNRVSSLDNVSAETLWLGVKIMHKLSKNAVRNNLASQLRNRYPDSTEYNNFLHGAYDE